MSKTGSLIVRIDDQSKAEIAKAAELRRVSISDYVRMATLAQARREIRAAEQDIISLSPEEQLEFWDALNAPIELTEKQRELGAIMRGEA